MGGESPAWSTVHEKGEALLPLSLARLLQPARRSESKPECPGSDTVHHAIPRHDPRHSATTRPRSFRAVGTASIRCPRQGVMIGWLMAILAKRIVADKPLSASPHLVHIERFRRARVLAFISCQSVMLVGPRQLRCSAISFNGSSCWRLSRSGLRAARRLLH